MVLKDSRLLELGAAALPSEEISQTINLFTTTQNLF